MYALKVETPSYAAIAETTQAISRFFVWAQCQDAALYVLRTGEIHNGMLKPSGRRHRQHSSY